MEDGKWIGNSLWNFYADPKQFKPVRNRRNDNADRKKQKRNGGSKPKQKLAVLQMSPREPPRQMGMQ
jgi:hypothetical protein